MNENVKDEFHFVLHDKCLQMIEMKSIKNFQILFIFLSYNDKVI